MHLSAERLQNFVRACFARHCAAFGGIANAPLDTCYHTPCDTLANVDHQALEEMTKTTAATLVEFAAAADARARALAPLPTLSTRHAD